MSDLNRSSRAVLDEAVARLLTLLRARSVSSDPALRDELLACADATETLLREKGFRTSRFDAAGFPAIAGETGPAHGPTLLFYAHYDVQPAAMEDGWSHDPFDPVVKDGAVTCRGASDDKGQLVGIVYGVEACRRAHGTLPCRVRVIFEGAEEIGSPGFEEALAAHKHLVDADLVVVADCGRFVPGRGGLIKSLRGLAYIEVFVRSTREDLHSGSFGGTVDNPAQVLAHMLAALKDSDRRVAVPGFYDSVRDPTAEELAGLEGIPFDDDAYRDTLGAQRLEGEAGYGTLARRWLRPALDINGITAGFQGAGSKTVLPAKASAKLSCRIVPDQDPHGVLDLLETFFRAMCPPSCSVSFKRYGTANPVKLDLEGREATWVMTALRRAYGEDPMILHEGATVPVVDTFASVLHIPPFPVGFGRNDDGAHGPDERFALEDLHREILAVAALVEEAAGG